MDSIDKINLLLAQKGMSGADLEREIGVSNSVYSQWNTKTTKPSNKSLVKVAKVLGVDVSAIAPDAIVQKEKSPMSEDTGLNSEFINLFNQLSPEDQAREIAYLRERVSGQDK